MAQIGGATCVKGIDLVIGDFRFEDVPSKNGIRER